MVDWINLILKAKNLTSRQFAEEIGIQPSGMSHILSGRNRPSLDFVMKVVNRYPEIDIKWLTLGEGEMFVSPYSMPVAPKPPVQADPVEPAAAASIPAQASVSVPTLTPVSMPSQMPPQTQMSVPPQTQVSQVELEAAQASKAQPHFEPDLFSSFELPAEPEAAQNPVSVQPQPSAPQPVVAAPSVTMAPEAQAPIQASTPGPARMPETNTTAQPAQLDENRVNDLPSTTSAEKPNLTKKRIVKVVILYDDHSFSEYYPE